MKSKKKDPGICPSGYNWISTNCHNFDTWQEEIDHAITEGFELVPSNEVLHHYGIYFTLRKGGFDTILVSGSPAGRYGYPIYQLRITNPDELRFNRFPILEHQNIGDCLRIDVGITPGVQHVYRMLWWSDAAQAYVGDGKWVIGGESHQLHQFEWDHKLEKDVGHQMRIKRIGNQSDSIKHAKAMQFAADAERLQSVVDLPPSQWGSKGIWYQPHEMVDVDKPVNYARVVVEGRAYEMTRVREGDHDVWDIKDCGLTQMEVQNHLVEALRTYATMTNYDGGKMAAEVLNKLGFSLSV